MTPWASVGGLGLFLGPLWAVLAAPGAPRCQDRPKRGPRVTQERTQDRHARACMHVHARACACIRACVRVHVRAWAILEGSWVVLGASWAALEPYVDGLGPLLGTTWRKNAKNMATLKMCLFLERERDLRPPGRSWAALGPSVGDLGPLLGPTLAVLGRSWGLCWRS